VHSVTIGCHYTARTNVLVYLLIVHVPCPRIVSIVHVPCPRIVSIVHALVTLCVPRPCTRTIVRTNVLVLSLRAKALDTS
jgi:hypothetical protein